MNQRINNIFNNTLFQLQIKKISDQETTRLFCKHDLPHLLDTARIGYILSLEKNLNIPKDIIYGAALLHDIGKFQQYENHIPHELASASLCIEILDQAGYNQEEIELIKVAILSHRDASIRWERSLSGVLYLADKLSRDCFNCKMNSSCKWSDEKKNDDISY